MSKKIEEKIEELEKELTALKNECSKTKTKRKFKVGDWVCFNHGEYPDYFSREVGQITHFDYKYDKEGTAQFKCVMGGGWSDDLLRHAHPKEIEYAKTGLPFIYNKRTKEYELVEINGEDFKVGDLMDTSKMNNMSGKEIITFLMDTDMLSKEGKKTLSIIFEKLK
jgi:hypothetical protein